MDTKSIFTSKTFWVNALTLIIGLVTLLSGQSWINPDLGAWLLAVVLPTINVWLRWLTTTEVTVLPSKTTLPPR